MEWNGMDWMIEWMNEWMMNGMNGMNEYRIDEWMNDEWMNEWIMIMNEWMEWME